jgi:hypothetical protein
MIDMGPGLMISIVALSVALVKVFRGPIGEAIADRLRGSTSPLDAGLLAEVDGLKTRLAELEERLDFSERLLAHGHEVDQLPERAHR